MRATNVACKRASLLLAASLATFAYYHSQFQCPSAVVSGVRSPVFFWYLL